MDKLRWLIIGVGLLLPFTGWSAAIPAAGDLVLQYENDAADKQLKYNYLFTVDGDATIYVCQANHCSMSQFKDKSGTVSVTLYKLPDGFPRPQTLPNQTTYIHASTSILATITTVMAKFHSM